MNEYKIVVKGKDIFGITFLKNVADLAGRGAVISNDHPVNNKFPHYAVMTIKTKETLVSDILNGIEVLPMFIKHTKEELDAMSWEEFKKVLKRQFGITGRDRDLLTVKYLQAVEESNKVG